MDEISEQIYKEQCCKQNEEILHLIELMENKQLDEGWISYFLLSNFKATRVMTKLILLNNLHR